MPAVRERELPRSLPPLLQSKTNSGEAHLDTGLGHHAFTTPPKSTSSHSLQPQATFNIALPFAANSLKEVREAGIGSSLHLLL